MSVRHRGTNEVHGGLSGISWIYALNSLLSSCIALDTHTHNVYTCKLT